ncbi:ABC-ATPase domain-containing protein [Natronoglycomyces albus]|uniref:ABC-ATPase domain-containing protein n=1 Tax=Natronoglycomyces albus TaxID=2811108 RepID=A0A895XMY4_9ACTN|nr:ABC-ATPase domain-containing protein [Natronoglycomyces albus]QSB04759.1 ABC-ATPase domain-containing protein [Natronoglycomyces albus]
MKRSDRHSDHRSYPPRHNLDNELVGMDGTSYGRYKSLRGTWVTDEYELLIQRVQSDPFAPPSRVAVRLDPDQADLLPEWFSTDHRRRAIATVLVKRAKQAMRGLRDLRLDAGGQEILDRSSCQVGTDGSVIFRLGAQLPGKGRRIDGHQAKRVLCEHIPSMVDFALDLEEDEAKRWTDTADDTAALRSALVDRDLIAFVADGAMLARHSGVDDRPLGEGVPFTAPDSLAMTVDLPHAGSVRGMGIKPGVTLIVGGGFHGKSTLLRALERGVYDHVPGDGRELVVANLDAVKIRAEDGRSVSSVDVHAFVDHLPSGADTATFTTENASGSTSQAAAIVEALEAGSRLLLIDEDTAATNLMIRDARMQALVAKDREPLTPLVDRIRSLYTDHGVSTVLVMGGSGDYMDVADRVIMMDSYVPLDVTAKAKELAANPTGRQVEGAAFTMPRDRIIEPSSINAEVRGKQKVKAKGTDGIQYGEQDVDLRSVEQLTDLSMTMGVALAIQAASQQGFIDGTATVSQVLDRLESALEADGVEMLAKIRTIDFALPRRHEIAAALNRMRDIRIRQATSQ